MLIHTMLSHCWKKDFPERTRRIAPLEETLMNQNVVRSGLLGVAVGDALGVPVEFTGRPELRDNPVHGMRGMGTHLQPPGTWSDDSSLTFCLAESLTGGYDLEDIAGRLCRWLDESYWTARGEVFDVGRTTARAIHALGRGAPPTEAGGRGEWSNGNGSLMRIRWRSTSGTWSYRMPWSGSTMSPRSRTDIPGR